MIQQTATILWNRQVGPACFRMGLSSPQGYETAAAGQFVMVRSSATLTPLLRRPFSIFGRIGSARHPEGIELLYKALGAGTRLMADMGPGCTIDLLGPLGRPFSVSQGIRRIYLAAGGMGVVPIRFLAVQLRENQHRRVDIQLFLGGRSQDDLLCRDDFQSLGIPVTTTTDDGSSGRQCLITDPLAEAIAENKPDVVMACGPQGMLQCVGDIAQRHQVPCQVSLETMMACGMGACLGCAVPKNAGQGYYHVCVDGPVFDVGQVRI